MNLGMIDFDFVRVDDELGSQTGGLALEDLIDELNGLIGLLGRIAVGDLAGLKLEIHPADSDGVHGWYGSEPGHAASPKYSEF